MHIPLRLSFPSGSSITEFTAVLAFFLVLNAGWAWPAAGQICSSTNITLVSQADVNNFQATYGPCTEVNGDLHVRDDFDGTADITNLDGLSDLTSIGDNLNVTYNENLTDIGGLINITSIGGYLVVGYNDVLTNIDGLANLTSVGYNLSISGNKALSNIDGLSGITSVEEGLYIGDNPVLDNIDGLSNLTSVGYDLYIQANDKLTDVDGLANITGPLNGDLVIRKNDTLIDVDGLAGITSVGNDLLFWGNPVLTSIEGLSNINSVGLGVIFRDNPALNNLDGLTNITGSLGGSLDIRDNPALTDVNALSGITGVDFDLYIQANDKLTDLGGLANITTVGRDLIVDLNDQLARCSCGLYDLLTTSGAIGGVTDINNNAPGCNSDTEVINQGPCDAGDCTPTMLAESAPYVGDDGAGRVDLTFSTPDGIEEIDFSLLDNLALETSAPAFDAQTTGGDGLPTYTYNTAPQQIDITLIQQDTGNESAGYFGIARSLCPWVDGDQLAVEFDPPLEFALDVSEQLDLAGAYPNPTPGAATVGFTLPAATDVRLAVYDVMGRKVATLIDQAMDAGQHEVRWTGRSAGGQAVASGVYLIRLEAGEQVATRRLTVVK